MLFFKEPQLLQASTVVFISTLCHNNSVANISDIATSAFLAFVEPKVELKPVLVVFAAAIAAIAVSIVFPMPVPFCTKLRIFMHIPAAV